MPGAVEAHSWCCGAEYYREYWEIASKSRYGLVCQSVVQPGEVKCCDVPVLCQPCELQRAVTAADDSRAKLSVVVRPRQCQHLPSLRHGDMSLSSDSEASNSSISDPRFGSQTVAPDSPTPYTDAIKVNIKRPQHFISTGPNS